LERNSEPDKILVGLKICILSSLPKGLAETVTVVAEDCACAVNGVNAAQIAAANNVLCKDIGFPEKQIAEEAERTASMNDRTASGNQVRLS
jgi:uncharacterized protein YqkB